MLKDGICGLESKKKRHLSLLGLMNKLKTFRDKVSALMYCQGNRTADITDSLQEIGLSSSNQRFSIIKEFLYLRKQKNSDLLKHLKALRQNPQIHLKNIVLILRKNVIITHSKLGRKPHNTIANSSLSLTPLFFHCCVCVQTSMTG